MSRYSQPFDKHRGVGNVAGPTPQEQAEAERASGNADIMRLLGGAAPFAGSAIGAGIGALGGPAGLAAGGAIGGGLGQVAGSLLNGGADMQTRKAEDADAKRQAKLQALMAAFGGRGR